MTTAVLSPIQNFVEAASPTEVRGLRGFTEAEFVLPDGPRKDDHFDGNWPRWQGEMLEQEMDPWWQESWKTGSRQSGKTLLGFEAPLLYHLFELREDVICLVPEMSKAKMIWTKKIEPVIRASRYANKLPTTGKGSRGGHDVDLIVFENGASMHFMGAGGADPPSSATARVVVITEANEMRISPTGDQGNPIDAVRGCTASFQNSKVYGESIITTEDCITWRQITQIGTDTRVMLRCPHCGHHQFPVRERLVGWQDAADPIEAAEGARYACEGCAVLWSAADRDEAIERARLLHRGQAIDAEGTITGERPRTRTLGTRWNAMCHPMRTMADIAEKEWNARKLGTEAAEMAICQYTWSIPYVSRAAAVEITNAGLAEVSNRGRFERRSVPSWVEELYLCVDVQEDRHYWVLIGVGPDDRWCIVDWGYELLVPKETGDDGSPKPGRAPTPQDRRRVNEAIDAMCAEGWRVAGSEDRMSPVAKGIDVGYLTTEITPWIKGRPGWYAMRGCGRDDIKDTGTKEDVPEHLSTWVEISRPRGWSVNLHRVNAHNVRTEVHAALVRDHGAPASAELPHGLKSNDYLLLHLSGEVWEAQPKNGKKPFWREVRIRHDLLDCTVYNLGLWRLYREILSKQPQTVTADDWFQHGRKR